MTGKQTNEDPTDQGGASIGRDRADSLGQERKGAEIVGRALFEILIVAVGVMLALAADEWRDQYAQKQLAEDARSNLRSEILANREAVFSRQRRIAQLYALAEAHPERVGEYVFDRRNRALLINDSAWVMAIETGALRWLTPKERTSIAEVYAGHQRLRDVTAQEMTRWAELAAFHADGDSQQFREDRDRAIRIWQSLAQRVQLANCAIAGRYERALGAVVSDTELTDFCASRPPDENPAVMYGEWAKRGWVSPTPLRLD